MNAVPKTRELFCSECEVVRRPDIVHCVDCHVCNDMHDHHCGVVQVCICARNYKYFVLFIFYSAMQLLVAMLSMLLLTGCFNNRKLAETYGMARGIVPSIVFGILGVALLAIATFFVCESPACAEQGVKDITKQLRLEYNKRKHEDSDESFTDQELACERYFGSTWNCCLWFCPI